MVPNWTKRRVAVLLVLCSAACRVQSPALVVEGVESSAAEFETPASTHEDSKPAAPTVEPFEIVLMARGGSAENPVYDFTVRSDGTTTLRYLHYKKGTQSLFEHQAAPESIDNLRAVLEASLLRHEEGEFGGEAGSRSSSRFHASRVAIEIRGPSQSRQIRFPRPASWTQYTEGDKRVFLEFIELWRATRACVSDGGVPTVWFAEDQHAEAVWAAVHESEPTPR